jgi:hypothetical protein
LEASVKNHTTALIVLSLASAATLSGCSFHANLTVPATSVATATAEALLTATDYDFEVDCGDDNVDLVDGTEVECTATDPANSREYEVTSTINEVDGTKYTVSTHMENTSDGGPEDGTQDTTDDPASGTDIATTTRNYIANLAASTLQEKVGGQLPLVDCGDGAEELDVVEDYVVFCELTDADTGNTYDTTVTMRDVDGEDFTIGIQVSKTPIN